MTVTNTERFVLLLIYFVGFAASVYLGILIQQWRAKKYEQIKMNNAYNRGWKAGYNFVGTIEDRKVDLESAVRILNGEELEGDRPFPRS